ncbi:aminotransferase [Desulfovibrio subterraneus]|uniref:aminodeoxychorismate lyase n=2 Tax=Desulfovibrio subterraneus TaxID=2718620 RepID=A0A7J0BGY6_9BACT|nr:aminotransferase class IV [Desulfovibrio subterraneus]GFM32365.1 aminotransferase [Desulfovibrio subterraneus]
MIPVCETEEYMQKLLSARRAGEQGVLAFYEHRIGCICRNPRLMVLPMDDHLAHRGDGIFESIKWEGGRIYQLDAHVERMKRSAKGLYLAPPCTWERLREIAIEVARAAETEDGMLRILVGRGPGGFGIDPAECPVSSLYVVAYRFKPLPAAFYETGVTAFRSSIPAKPGYMARMKNANYIPNVLMRREATERGLNVPLSFDDNDFLAEGATENVALVDQDGTLVIPEFTNALTGTTIMRAVDLVKDEMPVVFKRVREDDLYRAREVMIMGTTGDCVSIVRFEGQPIHDVRPGPVAKRIRALLREDIVASGVPVSQD